MTNYKVIKVLEDIKYQFQESVDIAKSKSAEEWQKETLKDNEEAVEALARGIEAVKLETPKKVKIQSWIDTKCPSCSMELSKHHGDGHYSIPKYYRRCPECGQVLEWGIKEGEENE